MTVEIVLSEEKIVHVSFIFVLPIGIYDINSLRAGLYLILPSLQITTRECN